MYDENNLLVRDATKKLVLFQGDSITDNYRSHQCDIALSSGYPTFITGKILAQNKAYQFLNRGISGNRIVDLLSRWKQDCINLNPDIISILIGVNDVWHELTNNSGTSNALFNEIYSILISETQLALPKTKIILMEPFVLHGYCTNNVWHSMSKNIYTRASTTRSIAEKYDCTFIPLQNMLDKASDHYGAAEISIDGIHPSCLGHYLIANQWISYVFPENK